MVLCNEVLELEIPSVLYNELLLSLEDHENIRSLCAEMKEKSLRVKLGTAKKLIRKVPDYAAASALCEMMNRTLSNKLLLSFYSHQMSESETHMDATQKFIEMRSRGISPDLKAWHILMGSTEDLERRYSYFSKLTDDGLSPNGTTYGLLVAGTDSFANALTLCKKLCDEGFKPTSGAQVVLIEKAPSYESALIAVEMLTTRGFSLTPKAARHLEAKKSI